MTPHLLVIDGMNLVRRVYEANMAPDSPQKANGALRSSAQSFKRALKEHTPTHCLWIFDVPGKNWRHELYPQYKENRKPMPEALSKAMGGFKEFLSTHGWANVGFEGYEADDAIGSVSILASNCGVSVTVLSTDKDLTVLNKFGVKVHDHFNSVTRDAAWCLKNMGVPPALMLDYLALVGDASDGIPGVDGVGKQTAAKLLLEHMNLDGVLTAAATMKGAIGEKLRAQADMARLSRKLTALRVDVFTLEGNSFDIDEFGLGAELPTYPGLLAEPSDDI